MGKCSTEQLPIVSVILRQCTPVPQTQSVNSESVMDCVVPKQED